MNKENNRGAAGLRRSAIAERIRLREEWSALKEVDGQTKASQNILKKRAMNSRCTPSAFSGKNNITVASNNKSNIQAVPAISDVLTGVVALVDVGSEPRALPLRAALTALGASVVTSWNPVVTHLIWTDSGTRAVRARARALACRVVSPLWVEACAAAARKLSERMFPAASRQSDLPSPRTLRLLLKKAERENVPLIDLLSDSKEDEMPRLRMRGSSGTDTSRDKTTDTSNDTPELEFRINTGRRGGNTERSTRPATRPTTGVDTRPTTGVDTRPTTGAATRPATGAATRPATAAPASRQPPKSRRKLFTHKEAQDISSSDDDSKTIKSNKLHQSKLTQSERRDLARAERMAKKLLAACNTQNNNNNNVVTSQQGSKPRIVLTGMSRLERQAITKCIQKLGGIIQNKVNKRTTHVLLGSCSNTVQCSNHPSNITGISTHCDLSKSTCWSDAVQRGARTLSALRGGAIGCRVLHARWAVESAETGKWLHHCGYEVQHLRKISQKARVERAALGRLNCEYAYDVFNGMRVRVTDDAEQRDAAIQLLMLCGALVQDGAQNGSQNIDMVIGSAVGEVNSKWVFDSVAIARMRTTRRYLNMNSYSQQERENR